MPLKQCGDVEDMYNETRQKPTQMRPQRINMPGKTAGKIHDLGTKPLRHAGYSREMYLCFKLPSRGASWFMEQI